MRLRTIKQTITEIRDNDPNTCLTEWGLRSMILEGAIPSIRRGAKYLIDIDDIEYYINTLKKGNKNEL